MVNQCGWNNPDESWKTERFYATLRVKTYHKGRSAVNIVFENPETGGTFWMGMKFFLELITTYDLKDAAITGWWGYQKQGTLIGLKYCGALA